MTLRQPERRILHAAMNGDERAFRQIVEEYRPPLLWHVRSMVRDRELAEEIVQEVFLSVYQHLPRFAEECLFTTWLYHLARNRALDALRSAECRPKIDYSFDHESVERTQPSDPDNDQTVAAIWRAVATLDEKQKRPLLLRDVTGLSYREIADTLEIPISAVKWRIFRARDLVREALVREGLARASTTVVKLQGGSAGEAARSVSRAS